MKISVNNSKYILKKLKIKFFDATILIKKIDFIFSFSFNTNSISN